jgi:hypothetical protein
MRTFGQPTNLLNPNPFGTLPTLHWFGGPKRIKDTRVWSTESHHGDTLQSRNLGVGEAHQSRYAAIKHSPC